MRMTAYSVTAAEREVISPFTGEKEDTLGFV